MSITSFTVVTVKIYTQGTMGITVIYIENVIGNPIPNLGQDIWVSHHAHDFGKGMDPIDLHSRLG